MGKLGPDWIEFRGSNRLLFSEPLEPHLRELPRRPDFRLPGLGYERGYMAQWEVRADHSLWLVGLKTRPDDAGPEPGLGLVFPGANGAIAATWVSQLLRSPERERRFELRGYGFGFAREANLAVWEGWLVMVEEIDGRSQQVITTEFTSHLEGVFGAEESSFLRTIRTAPEDTGPRLVYADWLDDRNDPRAAVIRLAERLRGHAPDAIARERDAYHDLLRRGQGNWLWRRILAYDSSTAELLQFQTRW